MNLSLADWQDLLGENVRPVLESQWAASSYWAKQPGWPGPGPATYFYVELTDAYTNYMWTQGNGGNGFGPGWPGGAPYPRASVISFWTNAVLTWTTGENIGASTLVSGLEIVDLDVTVDGTATTAKALKLTMADAFSNISGGDEFVLRTGFPNQPRPVSLTGSLAPHELVILSFGPYSYTNWNNAGTAQGYNIALSGLSRNRQRMTIIISNTMGVALSGDVWPSDSEYQASGVTLGETNSAGAITAVASNQSPLFYPSQSNFNIGVDTLRWNTDAPTTAPTSGELGITVIQEL